MIPEVTFRGDQILRGINDGLSVFRTPRLIFPAGEHNDKTQSTYDARTVSGIFAIDSPVNITMKAALQRASDASEADPYLLLMTRSRSADVPHVLLTEVLYPRDPRCDLPGFPVSKRKEITELLQRGTCELALRH